MTDGPHIPCRLPRLVVVIDIGLFPILVLAFSADPWFVCRLAGQFSRLPSLVL